MADQPTTPGGLPPPKRYQTQAVPTFEKWAEGRTGFSTGELEEIYAKTFNLTPEALKTLETRTKTKATETLKPTPIAKPAVPPQKIERPAPELTITRTPYPKWWNDSLNATINLIAPGSQTIATVSGNLRLYVATIVITVTDAVAITIQFGNAGASGPIFLGDTDQPKGIVIAMGNSPAPCGGGNLSISATDINGTNPSIGGFATCFAEEVLKT